MVPMKIKMGEAYVYQSRTITSLNEADYSWRLDATAKQAFDCV